MHSIIQFIGSTLYIAYQISDNTVHFTLSVYVQAIGDIYASIAFNIQSTNNNY